MLLTSAVTLWFAAAMSYPADLFTDGTGVEAAWGSPQDALLPADERDDVLSRVGRSGPQQELEPDGDSYARLDRAKAGSNFVRLGRWRPDNFVRLGRGGPPDSSFLRLGRARPDSFIRFGRDRAAQNYIRFGRGKADGFIRLGRPDEEAEAMSRVTRGGQTGTPRIRSRKAEATEGDLVAAEGGRREAEAFQRARRTGGSATFGRGKLTDSNFIRLGRRVKRSAAEEEDNSEDEAASTPGQSYLYPQLAADLPAYIFGPELSLLPQPSGLALADNVKREKNYIRFG
ncbi:hypothetical protein PR048_030154 [Dryococelus australis]|uniref:Uncharacterized protein n=1 Tax=Dryococelus australis TaxID=614101 RepID=A0ABQ9GAS8_9NEOP|nr:hypothetical protein PR048_030154 [Dryococelus australis]